MDEIVKSLGFADESEFHRLVAGVDLSSMEKLEAFKRWQFEDGTKEGLMRLQPTALPPAPGAGEG